MQRIALSLFVAVLLAGCAGTDWTKPGADEAALARDRGECAALAPPAHVDASPPPYPADQPGADMGSAGLNSFGSVQQREVMNRMDVDGEFMNRCMRGKGWTPS